MRDLTREQYLERFDDAVRAADVAGARSILQAILALQALEQNAGAQEVEGLGVLSLGPSNLASPVPNAGQPSTDTVRLDSEFATPHSVTRDLMQHSDATGLAGAAPEVGELTQMSTARCPFCGSIFALRCPCRDALTVGELSLPAKLRSNAKFLRDCHDDLSAVEANAVAQRLEEAADALSRPAVSEPCKHPRQLWNITGTQGHCKDCGADVTGRETMTEQRAREILGKAADTEGGDSYDGNWIMWGAETVNLDGDYTPDQLEAIAYWMRRK